jgi:threonine/homoserine/homoserine lactone efflux protein
MVLPHDTINDVSSLFCSALDPCALLFFFPTVLPLFTSTNEALRFHYFFFILLFNNTGLFCDIT